ncbi:MAG: hypothetical protein PHY08_05950 [Candidatus Cloacimonetes bacterium]|nr:hypothetical protein [Candidatus Cloacimonadota bacterium]MDD4156101.1 hypothetical protein [Candidatus Cloacimonadota bacterium]
MKNFFKKIFTIGAIAGVGYLGFKGYTRISEVIKLSKTLPDYLADLLDEKPNVDINMRLNSMSIAVGVTADTYENINFDLDSQINRYIVDYYPGLSKLNISTHKYIKSSSENETINKEESDVEFNQEIENDELDAIDDNIEDIEK